MLPNSPTALRDHNFDSLRATLDERRRGVLYALAQHGPCTTRQLALSARMDILSIRPRVTELKDLGLITYVGREAGEGVYAVTPQAEWQRWHAAQVEERTSGQLQLV
jgi:predicted transcriptional regulator